MDMLHWMCYLLFEGAAREAPLVLSGDAHSGRRPPVVVRFCLHEGHAAMHLHMRTFIVCTE